MLTEGDTAPGFTLPGASADDEEPTRYSLSAALRDGPAVLNFYLFDFHPECTEHMCGLHNLAWFDLADSVTVFGISSDRTFSHRAFAEAEGLAFPLLSDSDGSVAADYGVLYEEFDGHKHIAKRSVFVVDTDRTVRYAWSTDDPAVQPDWSAALDAVEALQPSPLP
ncbi:MAG: redoxin domain-containing protein [Halobacteriaceae archaeon]